jgi:uncharacterized membrane protein YcaP (DUF421 family)
MKIDWLVWLDVIIRSIISLAFLFFLTKMLGKKQVSQLSIFDYVIGISIGSIAGEMTINIEKASYMNGLTAMVVYAVIAYLISYLSLKSMSMRRFFTGTPVVLVENGKIIESGLKKSLIDVNDLLEECRSRGFFDLNEIEYAIMETSGKVSFLPKSEYDDLTPEATAVKPPYKALVANVIIDSKIMKKNLDMLHKTEYWLLNELKKQGYNTLDPLLLVTYDEHTHKIKTYEKINKGDTKTFLE